MHDGTTLALTAGHVASAEISGASTLVNARLWQGKPLKPIFGCANEIFARGGKER